MISLMDPLIIAKLHLAKAQFLFPLNVRFFPIKYAITSDVIRTLITSMDEHNNHFRVSGNCFSRKQKKRLDAAIWPKQLLWLNKASYFQTKSWRKYQKLEYLRTLYLYRNWLNRPWVWSSHFRGIYWFPFAYISLYRCFHSSHIKMCRHIIIIAWQCLRTNTFALFKNSKSKQNLINYITLSDVGIKFSETKHKECKNMEIQ